MKFERYLTRTGMAASLGIGTLLLFSAELLTQAAPPKTAPVMRYNRDIRPILSENCFACHGPDSAARKAGLRLDRSDNTQDRGSSAVILKGKPNESSLIKHITGQASIMPPPGGTRKPLSVQQIAMLKSWISQGANYELHWAYQPPKRASLPPVSTKNAKWARNPIDRFILFRLEQAGLTPAPEADRRTLARRLCLDLTGLPPEPADVELFLKDKSPNAYEKLVDKYLASPQWGEHRGRYWLDAARYADSNGIHFDNYREIWSFREWVIKAFNKNMPFDQFTIEQLAGDLMPNHTLDQAVATGFNRCNITTNEGGAIDEEYKVLYARDRTETTTQVWLGSTLGCAVCHDHKFDPFTQKDFYSLTSFFNNTTQAAMDGNIQNTPPVLMVPLEADRDRYSALKGDIASANKMASDRKTVARADFDTWFAKPGAEKLTAKLPEDGLQFHAPLTEGVGREVQVTLSGKPLKLVSATDLGWDVGQLAAKAYVRKANNTLAIDNAGDFEKDHAFSCAAWVKIPNVNANGAIVAREDDLHDYRGWDMWIEGGRVGTHIISKWPEDALKTVTNEPLSPGKWHHVCITYSGGANTASVRVYVDGTARLTTDQANTLKSSIRTTVPFKIGQRHTGVLSDGTAIQDIRLYERLISPEDVMQLSSNSRIAYLTSRGQATLSAAEKEELFGWWLTGSDDQYRTLSTKLAALQGEERTIMARGTQAHVMQERTEDAMAYILARGEYDKRKDPVHPMTPAVLPAMPTEYPKNRLGLAKWLMRPENPLTARVTVNRYWQELFGQGIVRTTGDFGVTGEMPINQELLDWLAVDFRENNWDIKGFFKILVTSATYRQSATTTPEKLQKDPKNRLNSRGPRFRMDAEMVRDYALAASGLLINKIGGPSVKPYQPDGVWEAVAMPGSNTRDYKRGMGDSLYRRSLYTFWKRAAPPASLDIFNAPSRETCTVRRERTNTPLQALVTLNDVQYIEAARSLAQRAIKEGGATPDLQIYFMAHRLLARPFRAEELAVVKKSLTDLQLFYDGHSKEALSLVSSGDSKPDMKLKPEKVAALTMLANQLMNLDEVLNK